MKWGVITDVVLGVLVHALVHVEEIAQAYVNPIAQALAVIHVAVHVPTIVLVDAKVVVIVDVRVHAQVDAKARVLPAVEQVHTMEDNMKTANELIRFGEKILTFSYNTNDARPLREEILDEPHYSNLKGWYNDVMIFMDENNHREALEIVKRERVFPMGLRGRTISSKCVNNIIEILKNFQ